MTQNPIPDHPPMGQIRFFDSIQPALAQGDYSVTLEQTFPSVVDGVTTGMSTQTQSRRIRVAGSRWSIDKLTIHSRSPPKNEQNVRLDYVLPKIVFQSKTLPWDRSMNNLNPDIPWMGLLLIRNDEFEDYCEVIADSTSHEILGTTTGPLVQAQALKITDKLLNAIGPKQNEIQHLVHGLQVNPKDKELCGSDEDGIFSVVMSNRVASVADTKYHTCLVSFEGVLDKLPEDNDVTYIRNPMSRDDEQPLMGGSAPILSLMQQTMTLANAFDGPVSHLVLLDYWTFKTGDGGDFESRIQQIKFRRKEADSEAVGELGTIYDYAEAASGDGVYEPALLGNDMDPDVSTNSFLLTEIVEDDGIVRPCLYRSPCVAVPTNHEPKDYPYKNSDDARGLEPSTGLDVIHHSAAFELGRLLALSDPKFIDSLTRWRRLWIQKQNQKSHRETMLAKAELGDKFDADLLENETIGNLLQMNVMTQASAPISMELDEELVADRSAFELAGSPANQFTDSELILNDEGQFEFTTIPDEIDDGGNLS